MKAKISRLAKGIFDKTVPDLEISTGMIEGALQTDGVLSGSFRISSLNGQEAKGVLYASTGRIRLKESSFVGRHAKIHYEIHSAGMAAGSRIKGFIWVISDGGELTLPVEIQVEDPCVMTSMGKIRNLFHFTNLVRNHYEEAGRLFVAGNFPEIFLEGDSRARAVYEGLVRSSCTDTAMEEFLIAMNKKSRVMLSLTGESAEYEEFEHSAGGSMTLNRSGWGFLPVRLEADGMFLRLQKTEYSSGDFSGSVLEIPYTVEESAVHAGENSGRIFIRTPYQELVFSVTVRRKREQPGSWRERQRARRELKEGFLQLSEHYFSFRLHRLGTESWCKRSLKLLERLGGLPEAPLFLELVKVQLLITQKKKGDAGFLLEQLENRVLRRKDRQPGLYAYYLYLRVLYTRDDRILKETLLTLQRMYEGGQDEWLVFWALLYLNEEYAQNKSLKLVELKEQYGKGARSPFLYYEACDTFNEQPALLRVLNDFELKSIWWGVQKGAITENTALWIAGLAQMEKHGKPLIYRILKGLYNSCKNATILESLLTLLIRDGRVGERYFQWYELGIQQQCNLTGLYEAFLDSMPQDYGKPIPKLAAMYFTFDSELRDEAREKLYENLLRYGQENPMVLQNHMPAIEQFALEQIEKGRVNRRLAFVYKRVVKRSQLNRETAGGYPQILVSRYIAMGERQGRLVVRHKECGGELAVPIRAGEACIPVYTEDAAILYEDLTGQRFLLEEEPVSLFHEEAFIRSCFELNPGELPLWLHICEKEGIYRTKGEGGIEVFRRILESPLLRPDYRNQLYQKIIEYYMENYDGEKLEEYLKQLTTSGMNPEERGRLVELLIARSMYREAYRELGQYGYEEISVNRLVKLCIYLLWAKEGEEDALLLELCTYVFFRGKYDETILKYLLKYYYGTTKSMLKLWQAARDFSVDTVELEERLIVQMLFCGSYVARIMEVFEDYYQKSVNQTVIRAYLAQQSREYFVNNLVVGRKMFFFIERELHEHPKEMPEICKLALLRHFSERRELTGAQIEAARRLIREFVEENRYFAFYKKFEQYMELPPRLRDKTIVEYQSATANRVEIHYMLDTGASGRKFYETRQMEKSYAAFYVMEFILFYGERLQYYIAECGPEQERLTESDTILMDRFDTADGESRYHLLNDICACVEMRDSATLRVLMQSYAEKRQLAQEGFAIL